MSVWIWVSWATWMNVQTINCEIYTIQLYNPTSNLKTLSYNPILMYFILIFMWKFIYDLFNFSSSKQVLNQLKSVWKRYWHWCLGQIYSIASVVAIIFIDILYHNMRKWASCGVRVESSDPYCCQTGLSLTYPRAAYELVGQWEAGIVSVVTTSPVSETAQPSQLISLGHLTYWASVLSSNSEHLLPPSSHYGHRQGHNDVLRHPWQPPEQGE